MTMRFRLIVAAGIIIPIGAGHFTSFALAQGPPPAQTPTSSSQGTEVKRDGPPSLAAPGNNFVSLEGRFSVSLPVRNHAFRGLTLPTPYGRAKGDAYEWRMKEASFVIGY